MSSGLAPAASAALGLARDRIVVVEARRRSPSDAVTTSARDARAPPASAIRRVTSVVRMIVDSSERPATPRTRATKPSLPFASSMRSGVAIGPWKRNPMP